MNDMALRMYRSAVHRMFDRLWVDPADRVRTARTVAKKRASGARYGGQRAYKARVKQWRADRSRAYAWLAAQLGVKGHACHFGRFDREMLRRVEALCRSAGPGDIRAFRSAA